MRVALACLLLIGAVAVACDDDDDPAPITPTSTTATAQPAASPTMPQGANTAVPLARDPVFGEDASFPDDVALIVETGCWQCDGSASGLVRVYRDHTGELRIDRLSDGLENFLGFQASQDGSRLTTSICVSGVCDGFNEPTPPPVTEKMMSEDGGITWTRFDADGGVATVLRDRLVMRRAIGGAENQWRYVEHPSGTELARPPLSDPAAYPFAVSPTEIRWLAEDGRALIDEGGSVVYILDQDGAAGLAKDDRINDARVSDTSVFLHLFPGDNIGASYLAWSEPNNWRIKSLLEMRGSVALGPALDADTAIANVTLPARGYEFLPAIVNLKTGTITPIRDPFGTTEPFMRGRNFILGLMRGPFARVISPGECLNIRETAALAAPVLTCAADGVLLHDEGDSQSSDGRQWRNVTTPSGVTGWADSQFLEVRP